MFRFSLEYVVIMALIVAVAAFAGGIVVYALATHSPLNEFINGAFEFMSGDKLSTPTPTPTPR